MYIKDVKIYFIHIFLIHLFIWYFTYIYSYFIWYKYDQTILGLILALMTVIFFISFFLSVGISENLFFVFMPNSIVIKEIPFNEVKEIVIKDDKDDFNLFY